MAHEKQNGTFTSNPHHAPPSTSLSRPSRTGICHSQQMLKHWKPDVQFDTIKDQDDENEEPERPSRIARIIAHVSKQKLTDNLEHIKIRKATKEEIMLVHSEGHWKRIEETATMSLQDLKDRSAYFTRLSLYVNGDTFDCARLSCGGVIEMCRAVMDGKIKNGFAVVRPPGHHSEPEDPSGFCVFNNAAISAKWLRTVYPDKVKKVLLVDWDVHHGNGIQRSFYYDSSVLYISIHRFLQENRSEYFYPGTDWGGSNRVGDGDGQGFNVNIPWPEGGMCDADYIYAFQRLVMPIAMEFDPDFVIVSAGFDAAKNDPLGECNVTPEGFAHMTHMLTSLASGKTVLALEGGYHLESLALSATECIKVLMGEAPPKLGCAMVASDVATETVDECLKIQSAFWKSLPRQGLSAKYELEMDGLSIPLGDVLKMHRSYDLYEAHGLCTIPSHDQQSSGLSKSYQNQIMVTDNVYDCKTLVLFMHDLGSLRNEIFTESANLKDENEALIAYNKVLMDWIRKNGYGLIDVQVLPSYLSDLVLDGMAKKAEQAKTVKRMVNWIWNQFISLSDCQNLILICLGEGCAALPVLFDIKDFSDKLKASVHIPSSRQPPLALPNDCNWHRAISAGFLGSTEEDRAKIQNTVKEYSYGKVSVSDKFRPSQILRSEWDKITEFIHAKLAGDLPSNGPQTNGNNLSRGTSQIASNGRQIPNGTPNGLRSEPPALPMDLD
ncbi:Histone deacetylase hda1, variant 2 [Puccinia graminis f. sp. tritici]|uniref:histone deacetylase n=2 Tax=Puccinia graminis f. sp. tritici TaxID=56615 RepID=A0A5B0PPP1_PUCGR|nr:Histone deacetylase hda1, variant 2 [Puccinia graminis f. sp. tritici]